jgi:hypothetical protein
MKRKAQQQHPRHTQPIPPASLEEASFRAWVAELVKKQDLDALARVLDTVQGALEEVEAAIDRERGPGQ